MAVYGQNNEYWEDSVKRDVELHAKYSDHSYDVEVTGEKRHLRFSAFNSAQEEGADT